MADNVLWSGEIADDEKSDDTLDALRAFNGLVAADERVDARLAEAIRAAASWPTSTPSRVP